MRRAFIKVLYFLPAILLLAFFALGFLLAPNNPYKVNPANRYGQASDQYPLGTDQLGRCLLSRLLHSGKTTLGIVVAASVPVMAFGLLFGLLIAANDKLSGFFWEQIIAAVTALPPLAYLIVFIAAWGNGIFTMLVAISISLLLRLLKLVKSRANGEMKKSYVLCAIASGASKASLLFYQILPNLIWDAVHFVCLSCADMILAIAGFSFIGLGLGDNIVDWGQMISEGRNSLIAHPTLSLWPALAIVLCTLAFRLLGQALERWFLRD